jgi:hypothetical protein
MSCKHDCERPPVFPRRISNRPGLDRIDYRIGHYADVRAHLFDRLNQSPVLATFTHREADDPAIALLEADATVVDILTFYQMLYANEAYLRTAQWPQSISDLVRLTGYRLAPGVAGETTFALTIKGEQNVTVPMGFGLKAQLENVEKPVEFETREALETVPALSAFNLYRPRMTPQIIQGTLVLRLSATDVSLKADDRLLLAVPLPNAAHATRLLAPEIVTVAETWESFGRRFVKLKTGIHRSTPVGSLRAYKVGETIRHFGHNAPGTVTTVTDGVPSTRDTSFRRRVDTQSTAEVVPNLGKFTMPLDREFDGIHPGDTVLVQGRFSRTPTSVQHRYTLVRRVVDVESRSFGWGMLTGAGTALTIDSSLLVTDGGHSHPHSDVRTLNFVQVTATPFTVYADYAPTAATSGASLRYYGRAEHASMLKGRRLLLVDADGTTHERTVHSVSTGTGVGNAFHTVVLDGEVAYTDFPHAEPTITVHGNIVDASQGKTIERTLIGSGDARTSFQSLALPKSPLTYLFDAARTPAQAAALDVYVDGIRWTRLDTLFNAGPLDQVYIVRDAADGASFVQFGDGTTGARPGSGRNNIVATYRVGVGAHGALKAGTKPQATGRLTPLDKVLLPVDVTTGTDAETAGNARRTAPARLQSLGRLVSIADYEAETRMLPNVLKASARWDAPEGVPAIVLTVLTSSGSAADLVQVRDALTHYSRCRGPARHPFLAINGVRQYVHIDAVIGYDPVRLIEDITRGIKLALGIAGEESDGIDGAQGLFGIDRRDFHRPVHTSEVIAAIQNVPGVVWVRLRSAQVLPLGSPPVTDPTLLPTPTTNLVPAATIPCPLHHLLALHASHLAVSFVDAQLHAECPS